MTDIRTQADLSGKSPEQLAEMMRAAEQGHTDIVRALVEKKVEVDARKPGGITALGYAVWHGHADVVQFLLDCGASLDIGPRSAMEQVRRGLAPEICELIKTETDRRHEAEIAAIAAEEAAFTTNTRAFREGLPRAIDVKPLECGRGRV